MKRDSMEINTIENNDLDFIKENPSIEDLELIEEWD